LRERQFQGTDYVGDYPIGGQRGWDNNGRLVIGGLF
jgi:hypothetical protein